ncbi:hypothetical protein AAG906_017885 [Vitis piasezkii]
MEVWSRREENAARKGKAPVVQMRDSTQEEETIVSKKTWSTLFPPSVDRRQGHRSSSEPLLLRGSSSSSEVRNMEVDFGTGFQMERGIRGNPLFRCPLSRHCNFSREETSAFREEDKEGKGLIFEGICEIPGAKNMEVCQPSPSQPPESSSFPSCSLESPLSSPSGPHLPNSISLSQSPTKNQVISKTNSVKGVVDSLKYVDIPVRDEEENQCALSNQLTESFTHRKSNVSSHKEDSNLLLGRKWLKCERFYALWTLRCIPGGRTVAPQVIETCWNVRGLGSRNKRRVVKDFFRLENPNVVMIQETKREVCEGLKYIKELENERGLVLKNAESITEEILLYFEKLYASPTRESWGVEGLDWSPISEESALRLDSPFTEEEISKAIFQLDRDKAPGPDGFTIAVFQDCWDVIKEDLVRVFAEFHRSGIINQSTNASFIVLLPKKSLTKKISDFRPISLITSLYKIIAKVLSYA